MFGPFVHDIDPIFGEIGVGMLVWIYRRAGDSADPAERAIVRIVNGNSIWIKRLVLIVLLILPTIIPSDWTQDVPARYGARHPGLEHSVIYPQIPLAGE